MRMADAIWRGGDPRFAAAPSVSSAAGTGNVCPPSPSISLAAGNLPPCPGQRQRVPFPPQISGTTTSGLRLAWMPGCRSPSSRAPLASSLPRAAVAHVHGRSAAAPPASPSPRKRGVVGQASERTARALLTAHPRRSGAAAGTHAEGRRVAADGGWRRTSRDRAWRTAQQRLLLTRWACVVAAMIITTTNFMRKNNRLR